MKEISLLNQVKFQFQGERPELREDLSAVHLSSDGHLWLGCDEGINIERLKLINPETKDTFGKHKSFNVQDYLDLPDGNNTEIDIEGLAESAANFPEESCLLYKALIVQSARLPSWTNNESDLSSVIRMMGYVLPNVERALEMPLTALV